MDRSFELVAKFNPESRQAFFSATMDALAGQDPSRLAEHIVASLLRAPSLSPFLIQHHIELASLLAALKSDPPGGGVFDAFRNLIEQSSSAEQESNDGEFQSALSKPPLNRMPPVGTFGGVAMSPSVAAAWQQMAAKYASAPEESITPPQILFSLLQNEPGVRSALELHGLRIEDLGTFLGRTGAV